MSKITLHHGDCLEVLRGMPDNSVDACVTDPPYGLGKEPDALAMLRDWMETGHHDVKSKRGFMGREWDAFVPQPALWREVLRVLKPGGHVVAFAGSRTYDLMALGLRIAGFEIRDMAAWLHGQGMSKSLNISKAIDAAAGAEREVVGFRNPQSSVHGMALPDASGSHKYTGRLTSNIGTTDEAKVWDGWYSGLKPAIEPAVLARKPLEGTIAANVLKWGTGGLNVDGCRIGDFVNTTPGGMDRYNEANAAQGYRPGTYQKGSVEPRGAMGRFPANVLHDGSDSVLQCLPDAPGQQAPVKGTEPSLSATGETVYGKRDRVAFPLRKQNREGEASADRRYTDKGSTNFAPTPGVRREATSAARFWFNSSDEMPSRIMYHPKANKKDRAGSKHVTVKPVNLLRWLVKLTCPPGGTILDPFAGSGTTGEAAFEEGFDCILIEREAEYFADIQRRMEGIGAIPPTEDDDLFGDIPTLEDLLGDIPA